MKFSEGVRLSHDNLTGCVVIRGYVHRICLAPRFLNGEIKTGIREDLRNQLGRYNDELDGIVLAYSNIKITNKDPILLYDNVDMYFVVQYDVVIFRALPGTLLKLLVAASFFAVNGLVLHCSRLCSQKLTTETSVTIYRHAKLYNAPALLNYCHAYFLANFPELLMHNESFRKPLRGNQPHHKDTPWLNVEWYYFQLALEMLLLVSKNP